MNIHKNARLTPIGRERIVRLSASGLTPQAIAQAAGVSPRTVHKWLRRYRCAGLAGLQDLSSRPKRLYRPTPPAVIDRIRSLRLERRTGKAIACLVGVSRSTVSRVLRRLGLNKMKMLEPAQPVQRYERERPGELIHIDIKKLGRFARPGHRVTGDRTGPNKSRGAGWEFVHVCIDDASRLGFAQIRKDERSASATAFLKSALLYYKSLGISVQRVMTDNGSCYVSRAFAKACKRLGLKHIRTRPYTPRTNGKAERFIQTALREWAYARSYSSSQQRAQNLQPWMHTYNWHRPHGSLANSPPISRLGLSGNNLLSLHS